MLQCTHCQAELPASAQFCSHCGTPVEAVQPQSSKSAPDAEETPAPVVENQHSETPQQPLEIPTEETSGEPEQEQSLPQESGSADEKNSSPAEDSPEQQRPSTTLVEDSSEQHQPTTLVEDSPEQYPSALLVEGSYEQHQQVPTAEDADQRQVEAGELDEPTLNVEQTQRTQDEGEDISLPSTQEVREADTYSETQEEDVQPRPLPARGKRPRIGAIVPIAVLIALVVLAGGAGAFVFLRQHTPASSQCIGQQAGCAAVTSGAGRANATHLIFSGTISGSMTLDASVLCQSAATGNLHTLTVTLSGTIGSQLYNFGFAIDNYHGPGTYDNTSPLLTILLDTPGEATDNGWGNRSPTDTGSITIERGERAGSISYLLSGFGSHSGTQVQISGNWICGSNG